MNRPIRKLVALAAIAGSVAAALWARARSPRTLPEPTVPVWPPLAPPTDAAEGADGGAGSDGDAGADTHGNDAATEDTIADTVPGQGARHDAARTEAPAAAQSLAAPTPAQSAPPGMPPPAQPSPDRAWVDPDADGECRISHPIKANADSGIFHVPGGASYARTKAERCYADAEAAEADGFRAARR